MPTIFDSILSAQGVDAEAKYASTYEGIAREHLASIDQAKTFVAQCIQPMANEYNRGPINDPQIFADPTNSGAVQDKLIPIEQMLADGFPSSKRCCLIFVFEGHKEETDEFQGDDSIINVALAVRMYFGTKTTAANHLGLWEEIIRRRVANPPAPVEEVKPAPPPNFDPPPIHGHNDDGTPKKKK